MSSTSRWMHVMYCDDLREEVGGKTSYMGVYDGKMLVREFPVMLPKLCVIATVSTPIHKPFGILLVSVHQDGRRISTARVSKDVLDNWDGDKFLFHFLFPNFRIESPCTLRVECTSSDIDADGFDIGALSVIQSDDFEISVS